ncbi:MAG TPA: hypothetical protein VKS60_00885 [Stellaceae bacterium]|nr:hypothetical protein [Stellaceae bacterium]
MVTRRHFMEGAALFGAAALWPIRALAKPNPLADLAYPDLSTLSPPPKNFSSNHNYYIYGGGQPIRGLVVTIEATEDMVSPIGLNMQLNCYSPAGANNIYQQYCMGFDPKHETRLGWSNECFPSKDYRWRLHTRFNRPCGGTNPTEDTCKGDLFNMHGVVGFFPAMTNRLPAGAKLIYELVDKPDGTIIGATYSFVNAQGKKTSTGQQLIATFSLDGVNRHVDADGCAPILALQMNIVGLNNGAHATLGSGAGSIVYQATTPLTALGQQPSGIASHDIFTAESSNIVYAQLGTPAQQKIVQKFRVSGS